MLLWFMKGLWCCLLKIHTLHSYGLMYMYVYIYICIYISICNMVRYCNDCMNCCVIIKYKQHSCIWIHTHSHVWYVHIYACTMAWWCLNSTCKSSTKTNLQQELAFHTNSNTPTLCCCNTRTKQEFACYTNSTIQKKIPKQEFAFHTNSNTPTLCCCNTHTSIYTFMSSCAMFCVHQK